MSDNFRIAFYLKADGAHDAAASWQAVAGVDVDVLAAQAISAMIGVTIADVFSPANFAGEVFYGSCEVSHMQSLIAKSAVVKEIVIDF